MMRIVCLTPCLMTENNRKHNFAGLDFVKTTLPVDEIVIYDQEFLPTDYDSSVTYIGHQAKRQGFVTPRNELLKWFYNSDYDYAFWIDANAKLTKPTLNDAITVFDALKTGKVDVDAVFSTLGIWVSQERRMAKQREDFRDIVTLRECRKGYNWMHGLFIKNFKKYHGMEVYIDTRCDPWVGTSEDIYFARLIQRLFNCYLCPTIIVNKPNNTSSTWMSGEKGYNYPPPDYAKVDEYINEVFDTYKKVRKVLVPPEIILPRLEKYKELIEDWKPRKSSISTSDSVSKVDIW